MSEAEAIRLGHYAVVLARWGYLGNPPPRRIELAGLVRTPAQ